MPNGDWVGSPYARLYATLQDDHPAVWADDRLLAWYVRLLVPAERAWPVRLEWPRRVPHDVAAALVEDGALDAHGEDRYQVHGLDRLRTSGDSMAQRGGQARAAQAARDPKTGTFLPSTSSPLGQPAGSLNGEPTQTAGPTPLVTSPPASPSSPAPIRPAPSRAAPSGPGTGTRTPAPATRPAPPSPSAIRCDDYTAHHASHQWWPGVGWRCSVCEQARADQEPTFREKVAQAQDQEEADDGRPF